MNLEVARKLARDLMDAYDFAHWSFAFDRAKTRNGQCDFNKQRITLSHYFVEMNDEALVRETILHEIAHAIAGSAAGHGPRWQMVARNLGVRPLARKASMMPPGKWKGVCSCGYPHNLHRKPKRLYFCRTCGGGIQWYDIKSN
jgi:predicted SprT family Zn-dependent metalloprotease